MSLYSFVYCTNISSFLFYHHYYYYHYQHHYYYFYHHHYHHHNHDHHKYKHFTFVTTSIFLIINTIIITLITIGGLALGRRWCTSPIPDLLTRQALCSILVIAKCNSLEITRAKLLYRLVTYSEGILHLVRK